MTTESTEELHGVIIVSGTNRGVKSHSYPSDYHTEKNDQWSVEWDPHNTDKSCVMLSGSSLALFVC